MTSLRQPRRLTRDVVGRLPGECVHLPGVPPSSVPRRQSASLADRHRLRRVDVEVASADVGGRHEDGARTADSLQRGRRGGTAV